MHFSTLLLPLYLMGMAASSPIQATDAIPNVELSFIPTKDIAVRDLPDSAIGSPPVDEKAPQRPVRYYSTTFRAGPGVENAVETHMTIRGIAVIVTAHFANIHNLIVLITPSFPNTPLSFLAGFQDFSKEFNSPLINWAFDKYRTMSPPSGEIFQYDDYFRFFWDA
ncbi:hypothetical protein ST47_g5063 [Ascochyta rabiei]|uniref:Uncharacterized protein n=1 Tax=Didymella rabiei TaxID=5454 RepID=A0A163EMK6_DIDRA|nr:hypothetical protein ST47_g5063 [Ascochyta rabiei]